MNKKHWYSLRALGGGMEFLAKGLRSPFSTGSFLVHFRDARTTLAIIYREDCLKLEGWFSQNKWKLCWIYVYPDRVDAQFFDKIPFEFPFYLRLYSYYLGKSQIVRANRIIDKLQVLLKPCMSAYRKGSVSRANGEGVFIETSTETSTERKMNYDCQRTGA